MKSIIIFLIKGYQKFISPSLGKNCRFHPTCSSYCMSAFEKYNFFKASYLSIKRIIKCHPFHPGGWDPLK